MIKGFDYKGLEKFYKTGIRSGIMPEHGERLMVLLQLLDAATSPEGLDLPGMGFHKFKEKQKKYFSVTVRANWRIIYQFDGEDAILVNYIDYH